jgi:hypothetical protein
MRMAILKEKVIDEIRKLENENLISEIYALLQLEADLRGVYELSEDQIKAMEEVQAQYKTGHYMTDEEARKDFEEWRKK